MAVDKPTTPHILPVVATGVHKAYGGVRALVGVDLTLRRGEVCGLLGPNGAGKTTLIEILAGLRRPDQGSVQVMGVDPTRERVTVLQRVGIQTQEFGFQPAVTPYEALRFFASLYLNPLHPWKVLEQLELTEKAHARFSSLSGGQRKRLALGRALIGNPALLFLDEPTSGVDPQGRAFLREQIRSLRLEGRTVLLATHDIHDAQTLCDRVVIIDRGSLVSEGSPSELISRYSASNHVRLEAPTPLPSYPWQDLPGVQRTQRVGQGLILYCQAVDPVLAALRDRAVLDGSVRVDTGQTTLEDVFLILTGRRLRE